MQKNNEVLSEKYEADKTKIAEQKELLTEMTQKNISIKEQLAQVKKENEKLNR